ncbi:MOSC domain-containing protein [Cupriavidus necator]
MTMNTLTTTIGRLFAGGTGYLDHEGHRSGIFKTEIFDRVRVDSQGILGDEHADKRVHGGPEKAVHQYAAQNFVQIARRFPRSASLLVPGSLGENISAPIFCETNVHIGDIFSVGTAIFQVSQPRSPCWKINHRFGEERMSVYVAQEWITGWYYRVLVPGDIRPGDTMTLLERQTDRFSIEEFWQVQLSHRPSLDDLAALIEVPGLAPDWKRRLEERTKWLRALLDKVT